MGPPGGVFVPSWPGVVAKNKSGADSQADSEDPDPRPLFQRRADLLLVQTLNGLLLPPIAATPLTSLFLISLST